MIGRTLGNPNFLFGVMAMAVAFFCLLFALSWGDVSLVAPAAASLIASDFDGFRALLNNRRMELHLSMLELDHIAGLPSGYAARILAPPKKDSPYNRKLGPESLCKLLDALVVGIRLVPDNGLPTRGSGRGATF